MIAITLALLLAQQASPPPNTTPPATEHPSPPATVQPGQPQPPSAVPPNTPAPPGKQPDAPGGPTTPMADPPAHGQGGKPGGQPPSGVTPGPPIDPGPPCEQPPCKPFASGPITEPVLANPAPVYPQTGVQPPALSEIDQLRIENHALRLRLVQLEQQVQTVQLSSERNALDAMIEREHEGWRMDWQTGQLVRKVATPPAPAAAAAPTTPAARTQKPKR